MLPYTNVTVIGNLAKPHALQSFQYYVKCAPDSDVNLGFETDVWPSVGGNPFHIAEMAGSHGLHRVDIGKHQRSSLRLWLAALVLWTAEGNSLLMPVRFTDELSRYAKALMGAGGAQCFNKDQLHIVLRRISESLAGVSEAELLTSGVSDSTLRGMAAANLIFFRPHDPIVKDEFCADTGEDVPRYTAPSKLQWWALKQAFKVRPIIFTFTSSLVRRR
jgi:hypothetical protein